MTKLLDLLRESKDPKKRRTIAEQFSQSPSDFERLVVEVFESENEEDKHLLLDITDLLTEKLVIQVLSRAIVDPSPEIRVGTLQATYRTRIDTLNDAISNILQNKEETFNARKWAVHILATTDSATYGKSIRKVARDASEDLMLRKEAIFALTNIADEESIGALCALLGDTEVEMRTSGAWALSKISSRDSVVCLLAALDDECDDVREWAIRGLRDMDDSRALQGLADAVRNSVPKEQVRLIRLLAEKRSEIILRAITEVLLSNDTDVRMTAAWALGVSPYPPAVRNLEELLNDPDEMVRHYAKTALLRLGRFEPSDFGLKL